MKKKKLWIMFLLFLFITYLCIANDHDENDVDKTYCARKWTSHRFFFHLLHLQLFICVFFVNDHHPHHNFKMYYKLLLNQFFIAADVKFELSTVVLICLWMLNSLYNIGNVVLERLIFAMYSYFFHHTKLEIMLEEKKVSPIKLIINKNI